MSGPRMPVTVGLTATEINAIKAMVAAEPKTTFSEQLSRLIAQPARDAELIEAAWGLICACDSVHGNPGIDAAAGRLWRAVFPSERTMMYQHNVRVLGDITDSEGGRAD